MRFVFRCFYSVDVAIEFDWIGLISIKKHMGGKTRAQPNYQSPTVQIGTSQWMYSTQRNLWLITVGLTRDAGALTCVRKVLVRTRQWETLCDICIHFSLEKWKCMRRRVERRMVGARGYLNFPTNCRDGSGHKEFTEHSRHPASRSTTPKSYD